MRIVPPCPYGKTPIYITKPDGSTYSKHTPISTVEKITPKRKLYHIGQLFSNFNPSTYFRTSEIQPAAEPFISNIDLKRTFPGTTDADWNELKTSITNSILYDICRSGTQPFQPDEFVCSITLENDGPVRQMHDIYRILPNGYIEFWERDPDNDFVIIKTDQVGRPGLNDYPALKKLFRLHATPIKKTQNYRLVGLQYKKITEKNTLSWPTEGSFGIIQNSYETHHKGNTFSAVARNFRKTGYEDNDHFATIKSNNPTIDWHKKFQAIKNAYVESNVKNVIWRMIAGKLYLGNIAFDYLTFRKRPLYAQPYEHCPYCPTRTHTKSTIEHQIWSCPSVQPFWKYIRDLFVRLDIPFPIHAFNDLITFFNINDVKSLTNTFRNQLIFNAVYSIWIQYNTIMRTHTTMDAHEFDSYVATLTSKTIDKYNSVNRHSFLSLPYISQSIAFRSHAQGNADPTRNALQARYQQLQPYLAFNPESIDESTKTAYTTTWCKQNILANFHTNKVVFCPLLAPPQPQPPPS